MKLSVYNQQASKVSDLEVSPSLFGLKVNKHLVAESVRVLLSNARVGLAHTKTRGDVRGGGKKPWKQKGTGRARAGSNRSPIWRHGGVTFGPRSERNWHLKINKKAKTSALLMSVSDKVASQKLFVLDKLEFSELRTKFGAEFLKTFSTSLGLGKKLLLVLADGRSGLVKVFRNIPNIEVSSAKNLNILEVLKATDVIMEQSAVAVFEQTFKKAIKEEAK